MILGDSIYYYVYCRYCIQICIQCSVDGAAKDSFEFFGVSAEVEILSLEFTRPRIKTIELMVFGIGY